MDFQDIILSRCELKALKDISARKIAEPNIDKRISNRLYEKGFIDINPFDKSKARNHGLSRNDFYWKITEKGRDYLLYALDIKDQRSIDRRHFWITTVIAIVALIKSFLPEICGGLALLLKLLMQK